MWAYQMDRLIMPIYIYKPQLSYKKMVSVKVLITTDTEITVLGIGTRYHRY